MTPHGQAAIWVQAPELAILAQNEHATIGKGLHMDNLNLRVDFANRLGFEVATGAWDFDSFLQTNDLRLLVISIEVHI